jgi:hypothetical protein
MILSFYQINITLLIICFDNNTYPFSIKELLKDNDENKNIFIKLVCDTYFEE